jgi:hypothetical protein
MTTHRPNSIDLSRFFTPALFPRNGFTASFALSPVTRLA